jgi:peptide/nickel transport system permease protein
MDPRKLRVAGRRLLQIVPVVVLATFVVFGLLHLVPGDPAVTLAGDYATPERIEEIRRMYGFDRPFLLQYWNWLSGALQGDLGRSMQASEAVTKLIAHRFPNTLLIVAMALGLSMAIGVPLGILAATRSGGRVDATITTVSSVGVALPNFWLAMILVAILALGAGLFPVSGSVPVTKDFLDAIHHAVLPAIALAAGGIAEVTRQLRSALLEVLSSQFVRTLHAKGLSPVAILWKHGLKNVSVTLLTVLGLLVNRMLGATVVIEAVFAIPGMGSLVVAGAVSKDFPVVQGVVLTMVVIVVATNLVVDMLYALLDPRVGRE